MLPGSDVIQRSSAASPQMLPRKQLQPVSTRWNAPPPSERDSVPLLSVTQTSPLGASHTLSNETVPLVGAVSLIVHAKRGFTTDIAPGAAMACPATAVL